MEFATCRLNKAAEETGYTAKALNQKIDSGVLIEGKEWCSAPDGSRHIIKAGFNAWVSRGR